MKNLITILALLSMFGCATAQLDLPVTAGLGKSVAAGSGQFERMGSLGLRYGDTWKVQANGGYWLAQAPGESASAYGSLQGGLEVVGSSGLYCNFMIGPAWIQNPDAKLSGHFQFHPTFGCGVHAAGYSIGGQWMHWSNAGFIQPNLGRDMFPCLTVTIPLYRGDK